MTQKDYMSTDFSPVLVKAFFLKLMKQKLPCILRCAKVSYE